MKLSLVTPTRNIAPYIEKCIGSVLAQGVEDLEYIIVDGASTDETLAVVNRYANRISRIVSEPDKGTYDAVNKGFALSTGEIMGWIGGDDFYPEGALQTVVETFRRHPAIEWITSRTTLIANEQGHIAHCIRRGGFSRTAFLDGCFTEGINTYGTGFINQESTFWRRGLWQRAGGKLSLDWSLAGDFELWARFFHYSEIACVEQPLSCFRLRPNQNSQSNYQQYKLQAAEILESWRKSENYTVPASPPSGLRAYKGNHVTGDRIVASDFYYLDAQGTLGQLKPLIARNFIS